MIDANRLQAKSRRLPYLIYLDSLRRHWVMYGLGTLAMLITNVMEVAGPCIAAWVIDTIASDSSNVPQFLHGTDRAQTLRILMSLFLASLSLAFLGRYGWRQTLGRRTHDAGYELKTEIWLFMRMRSLTNLRETSLGDIMARATGDWNATRLIFGFTLAVFLDLFFLVVLVFAAMFFIDWQIALGVSLLLPTIAPMVYRYSQRAHFSYLRAQEILSRLSERLTQSLITVRQQRAMALHLAWRNKLNDIAAKLARQRFRVSKLTLAIFPIASLPMLAASALILTFGVWKVRHGLLSVGELVAFQTYVLLVAGPLREFGNILGEFQRGFASLGRICDLIARGNTDPQLLSTNDTPIAATKSTEPDLLNVDNRLHIKAGERIALCGPVGSGKTRLLLEICGLVRSHKHVVKLQGQSLDNLKDTDIARIVAFVPQQALLFSGPLRLNLTLDQDYSDKEIFEALDAVKIAAEVRALPDGLDTIIGEWGLSLSGGQRQRLSIARALLRHTPILVLDDAMSAVDEKTELDMIQNINQFDPNQAIVFSTHRLRVLSVCHRVYELKEGVLELIKQEGGSH